MSFAALLNPQAALQSVKSLTGTVRQNIALDEPEPKSSRMLDAKVPTPTQYRVLAALSNRAWWSVVEVGEALGISRQRAHWCLDGLVHAGYVENCRAARTGGVGRSPLSYRVKT